MRQILLHSAYLILLSSCLEDVQLPHAYAKPQLVIFGWVTDQVTPYEVKLNWTNEFADPSTYERVSGATVYVLEDGSVKHYFVEKDATGKYYSSASRFVGKPGHTYQLFVEIGDTTYTSSQATMPALSPIEEAQIKFVADPQAYEVDPDAKNYYVAAYIKDHPRRRDYYRWKVYVNGQLRNEPEALTLFNDQFTNGNRFSFSASEVLFTKEDHVSLTHLSLTQAAYEYYQLLKRQTNYSALSPRSIPAALKGNITWEGNKQAIVLGYFGVSAVRRVDIKP